MGRSITDPDTMILMFYKWHYDYRPAKLNDTDHMVDYHVFLSYIADTNQYRQQLKHNVFISRNSVCINEVLICS